MFVEKDGILIIEAESTGVLPGDWKTRSSSNETDDINKPGQATGGDFIVWEGNDYFNDPTKGVLTYEIEITTPGLYQFQWRSQVGQGTDTKEHNDSWLKINSDMFYGREVQSDGSFSYVYPPGPAPDPSTHPAGAVAAHGGYNKEGFFKVFSSREDWTWSSKTSDGDQYDIFAEFDEPGVYEIQIAARSSHHVIDRLMLHHVDYEGDPYDLSLPQSEFKDAGTALPQDPDPDASGDVSVFLLDAKVNSRVDEIEDGDVFSADQLYGDTFSLAVETTRTDVNSARLTWLDDDGKVLHREVDNTGELYTLFGDEQGSVIHEDKNYKLGTQSLQVELFTGRNATGTKVVDQTTDFTMIRAQPPKPPRKDSDPAPELDPNGLAAWADHIIFSYDGNEGDPDDIAAMPIVALMAEATGTADKTSFYYGNAQVFGNPINDLLPDLEKAAEFSRGLGIDSYSYQEDVDGTIARLVNQLNSGQKVLFIEGGRLDAIYEAFKSVDPALHKNVTMLSHSIWNENGGFPTWTDMQVEYPDVTYVRITDQNNGPYNTKGFRNLNWDWMDESNDPDVQEARALMELVPWYKLNDPSDAGMFYYALTGDETGGALDVKAMIENPETYGTPSPPSGPTNRAPVAVNDYATTEQNQTIRVDVLDNDRDADGNRLTLRHVDYDGETAFVSIENGMVEVNPKSSATNYRTEIITYTVSDGRGGTDKGVLRVEIGDEVPPPPPPPPPPSNRAPVARDDTASTSQNTTIKVDVLRNDTDPNGHALRLTGVDYDGRTSIVSIEDGKVVVNPKSAYTHDRTEVITYTVSDGRGGTDQGILEVDIVDDTPPLPRDPVNQAPVAKDDAASTPHNKTISVDVLRNDTDANGDRLTLTDVSYEGTTAFISIKDGKIVVNPKSVAKTARVEEIEYTVSDGKGGVDKGTLNVRVAGEKLEKEKLFDVYVADVLSDDTLGELKDLDRLLKSEIGSDVTFYVSANSARTEVDHVELTFGSHTQKEKMTPYALFGDINGDFGGGTDLDIGKHELEYKAFSDGELIEQDTVAFWVE